MGLSLPELPVQLCRFPLGSPIHVGPLELCQGAHIVTLTWVLPIPPFENHCFRVLGKSLELLGIFLPAVRAPGTSSFSQAVRTLRAHGASSLRGHTEVPHLVSLESSGCHPSFLRPRGQTRHLRWRAVEGVALLPLMWALAVLCLGQDTANFPLGPPLLGLKPVVYHFWQGLLLTAFQSELLGSP